MDVFSHFSPDYRTARGKFLDAATALDARIATYDNPAPGPDGAPVHTDVALIGPEDAEHVLLINSATHGVEGFCGSAAIIGWLRSTGPKALPENTRAVLIHALNPHGFAWVRRVTEDNVDLNRNFVDHDGAHPKNSDYGKLHPYLVPAEWTEKTLAACQAKCAAYAKKNGGAFALQAAVSRGQYDHADGLFYGGRAPTWSNRTYCRILESHLKDARRVAALDFHTGLGPYGTAELIGGSIPDMPPGDRAKQQYALSLPSTGNSSSSPALTGTLGGCLRRTLTAAKILSVTVEFGTFPVPEVFQALMADNWLHLHGNLESDLGRAIKADIRLRLYPDEDDWKEMVALRSGQVIRRAIAALADASGTD